MDVIETLTDSAKPSVYWSAMKVRVHGDDGIQLSTICKQLKLQSSDGKMRLTDVANVEQLLRQAFGFWCLIFRRVLGV